MCNLLDIIHIASVHVDFTEFLQKTANFRNHIAQCHSVEIDAIQSHTFFAKIS